jgi:hypothetical protein
MAKPSRSTHFVSIAWRASNMLRLGFATAALQRHPAKHAAVSGCASALAPRLIYRRNVSSLRPASFPQQLFHAVSGIFIKICLKIPPRHL